MSQYVFSSLANPQRFIQYASGGADIPVPMGDGILIAGGTGVANRNLITPLGVMTEVSDEDAAYLAKVPAFQAHVKAGHITIEKKRADPEKVAAGMNMRDGGAPKTPADFGDKAPAQ